LRSESLSLFGIDRGARILVEIPEHFCHGRQQSEVRNFLASAIQQQNASRQIVVIRPPRIEVNDVFGKVLKA